MQKGTNLRLVSLFLAIKQNHISQSKTIPQTILDFHK